MLQILRTDPNNLTNFILRLTLGLVLFPHGAQKLFGWFGGPGYNDEMAILTGMLGLPSIIATLVIVGECLGSVALIFGLGGRVMAICLVLILLGAFKYHGPGGFFMNWGGDQDREGYEFHLLAIGIAIPIILFGSGKWSVDAWLLNRFLSKKS